MMGRARFYGKAWRAGVVLACLLACASVSRGQAGRVLLQGYVLEEGSLEPLAGATVWDQARGTGATTNALGHFSLWLPLGDTARITVAFVGFADHPAELCPGADTLVRWLLRPGLALGEVVVSQRLAGLARPRMGVLELPVRQLVGTPMLLGIANLQKVLLGLPGVQGTGETSSDFLVRGGEMGENLVLLDDIPLFHSSHLGGFFSVFNEEAVGSAELVKGDFEARHGGRLSSVLDVRMKRGGSQRHSGVASLGLLAAQATLDGPGLREGHTYMVSARKSVAELVQKGVLRLQGKPSYGTGFHDLYLKYGGRGPRGDHWSLSLYQGQDVVSYRARPSADMGIEARGAKRWTSTGAAFRLAGQMGKAHYQSPLVFSRYSLDVEDAWSGGQALEQGRSAFSSRMTEFRWSSLWERPLGPGWEASFGHEASLWDSEPFRSQLQTGGREQLVEGREETAFALAGFAQASWRPNEALWLRAGLRLAGYAGGGWRQLSPEPRLGLSWSLGEALVAKASYSRGNQMLHQLGGGQSFPTKIWVPATAAAPPSRSDQWAAGLAGLLDRWALDWQFDLFLKTSARLARLRNSATLLSEPDWEGQLLTQGTGKAYGAELLLRRSQGSLTGWLGLSYTRSLRAFPGFAGGQRYPHSFARPWDFSVNLILNRSRDTC